MVDAIVLSLAAVDVLGEQLRLNVRQYPFDLPRLGQDAAEREQISRRAWEELETAGLAESGRPEPEVEDALYLLSSSELSIAAAGLVDVNAGTLLAARVVATGEVGVVGVLGPRGLRMSFTTPDELPARCAELLPEVPPGPGNAVRAPVQDTGSAMSAVAAITERAKLRIGHYLVTGSDRRGRRYQLPGLTWFDNDHGRYVLDVEPDAGGEALVCAPADREGIAQRIGGLVAHARSR